MCEAGGVVREICQLGQAAGRSHGAVQRRTDRGNVGGRILDALERLDTSDFPVEVVANERFVHGSIVSLQVAGARLLEGAIWMDADVLYPAALLARLVRSEHQNGVLLDGRSEENGEEMMIGTRAGRASKAPSGVSV